MTIMLSDRDVIRFPDGGVSWRGGANALSQPNVADFRSRPAQPDRGVVEAVHDRVRNQLAPLMNLKRGWDSYGAPPIDRGVTQVAADLLVALALSELPLPYVVPTSAGGLALEWHRQSRELVVEFDPQKDTIEAYFVDDATGEEWESPFPATGRFIPALLSMAG